MASNTFMSKEFNKGLGTITLNQAACECPQYRHDGGDQWGVRDGKARKISRWFFLTPKGNASLPEWMWESTWGIWLLR